jgi:hypothetical protein
MPIAEAYSGFVLFGDALLRLLQCSLLVPCLPCTPLLLLLSSVCWCRCCWWCMWYNMRQPFCMR